MKSNLLRVILIFVLMSASFSTVAQSTLSRVNVSSEGEEADYWGLFESAVSDYGHVAFCSTATNLVPNDTNRIGGLFGGPLTDVFVHHLHTGITERISVSSNGDEANENNAQPAISADGRFVVFSSAATNLVELAPEYTGIDITSSVYLRDRVLNETILVSRGYDGSPPNEVSSGADISADGNFIVFISSATNLTEMTPSSYISVYLYNRLTEKTILVSKNNEGFPANGDSQYVKISGDGRYIIYLSKATNLDIRDLDIGGDLYRYDTQTGTTELVGLTHNNQKSRHPRDITVNKGFDLSADGNFVAFSSYASDLVLNDNNNLGDIFLRDISRQETIRVNVLSTGEESNHRSDFPSISADGRFITFQSNATNLVENDTNGMRDVFIFDRNDASFRRVSPIDGAPQANSSSGLGDTEVSNDGRYVSYASIASNLVESDFNRLGDIFLVDFIGNAEPNISILSPTENATLSTEELISLSAQANDHEDGDISSSVIWTSDIDGEITSPTYLSEGTHTLTASVTDSGGLDAQTSIQIQVSAPIQLENIASIGYTPIESTFEQSEEDNRIVLTSGGVNIGGWVDSFGFVYQEFEGDVDFIAQITHIENAWSAGGIMIRQSLDQGSAFVANLIEKNNGGFFMIRDAEYTPSTIQSIPTLTEGSWLRLQREADEITSYYSQDGETWTEAGSIVLPDWDSYFIGLAGTTVENMPTTDITFENISIH